ncbi:fimbria/pilus periplasmic chaperone [Hafnia alvei]|uniref:fimbria/pilus periplasmic chaperone n=1 Tax=Hafnia alvei TaxID=569 RepID=UPI000E057AA0|nr:fimbria/pilus periplasmic chaperone [Hafnia alvei]STQ68611.1 Chaperone protein fimC precursor [Hafnia alvei]
MRNVKINSLINLLLFSSMSICGASAAIAGGVGLGTTRVIYPQNSSQASLSIQNTDASKVFLIQSWVSNPDGNKGNDSNLLIVFYVQIMPDDFVMQLHRF